MMHFYLFIFSFIFFHLCWNLSFLFLLDNINKIDLIKNQNWSKVYICVYKSHCKRLIQAIRNFHCKILIKYMWLWYKILDLWFFNWLDFLSQNLIFNDLASFSPPQKVSSQLNMVKPDVLNRSLFFRNKPKKKKFLKKKKDKQKRWMELHIYKI